MVIDELYPKSLRQFLKAVDQNLHLNDADPPQPLGSRNLLQRVALIAGLIEDVRPDIATIPPLVKQAEARATNQSEPGLQAELIRLGDRIRDEFGPLAFLYDLRTHGGVAHPPDKKKVAEAAAKLGLPTKNWHRSHYLRLLNLVAESVRQISGHFEEAAQVLVH